MNAQNEQLILVANLRWCAYCLLQVLPQMKHLLYKPAEIICAYVDVRSIKITASLLKLK